jgi:hypothetical protein
MSNYPPGIAPHCSRCGFMHCSCLGGNPRITHNPGITHKVRPWIIGYGGERQAHKVTPRGRCTFSDRSMVNNFRPLALIITAVPKARLTVEVRIGNIIHPLGMCEAWSRLPTQLANVFATPLQAHQSTIGPSVNIDVVIFNRYHRFSTEVSIQVEGVYHE